MSTTTHPQDLGLFQTIQERHTVRKYEQGVEIPEQELNEIIEAATQAPSSWNLQHWKFLVIDDQQKKEQLLPIAYNQQQIVDSSAVIAILGDLEANKNADEVYQGAVEQGFMTEDIKNTLVGQINGAYAGDTPFPRDEAVLNASLASMQLMLAAKAKGYDTCPMGGFQRDRFVKEFNVPERYVPVMLITVGKAAKPAHQSSRFPLEEVVVKNTF
ncbi:nitroreductase family protein [Salipaludibacillus keqinensis]|uniref:Nitroreductase family protein n=1 Tax=Salipaludibacillus keqinensis TaxID=2045207 RepID=A0A323TER7_9BACI|nr:nitroreductase family protein [Salipaludibacillus keqinensis]PYZ92217.1 nitroreductase family protein [Salipaludibacillus keqinensis]